MLQENLTPEELQELFRQNLAQISGVINLALDAASYENKALEDLEGLDNDQFQEFFQSLKNSEEILATGFVPDQQEIIALLKLPDEIVAKLVIASLKSNKSDFLFAVLDQLAFDQGQDKDTKIAKAKNIFCAPDLIQHLAQNIHLIKDDGGDSVLVSLLEVLSNFEDIQDVAIAVKKEICRVFWSELQKQENIEQIDPAVLLLCRPNCDSLFHQIVKTNNSLLLDWALKKLEELTPDDKATVINQRDKNGMTALLLAASMGLDGLIVKLAEAEFHKEAFDEKGKDCVQIAVEKGFVVTLKIMQNNGFNVENYNIEGAIAKIKEDQKTKLIADLQGANEQKCAEILLQVAGSNNANMLELLLAEFKKDEAKFRKILSAQGDIGATALHVACERGFDKIAEILIDSKLFWIDALDQNGKTPLALAVKQGFVNSTRFLLEKGASLDGDEKNNPLCEAVINNQETIAQLLLEKGANVDAKQNGKSALEYAKEAKNANLLAFLEEKSERSTASSSPELDQEVAGFVRNLAADDCRPQQQPAALAAH